MVNRQVVNSKLRKDIQDLYRTAYKNGGKYVEESALLQRTIRNLFPYLSNAGLANYPTYPKPNELYHKVSTDSIGTFCATICRDNEMNPILFIKGWDWKIDPYVFPNLYGLILSMKPIYDVVSTDNCGFSIVKDARGYYNHTNSKKQLISNEWFQKVTPFQNINGFIFAYARKLNGEAYYRFSDGTLGRIDDNYTRQNAQALLGESRIHQIIMEVLNQYLKQNLILN